MILTDTRAQIKKKRVSMVHNRGGAKLGEAKVCR